MEVAKASAATMLGMLALAAGPVARAEGEQRCASVADDRARLACYDAAFGRPAASTGDLAPAATSSVAGTAGTAGTGAPMPSGTDEVAAKARDEFGLSESARRARQPDQATAPDSITGQVAKIGYRPTGEMVVTLADGQVWSQIEPENRSRVKEGDTVTIRKATLGSYLLTGPGRIAVRVRRLK